MIIQSLLDTDLYKLTMMQVVLHQFPRSEVTYQFHCRNPEIDFSACVARIKEEIQGFCQLRFSPDELAYLKTLPYLKADFIEFLRLYQANPDFIEVSSEPEFRLRISGPWLHTILFEVPLLAIISQVYYEQHYPQDNQLAGEQRLTAKINWLKKQADISDFRFSDFGTRRRYSASWQHQVVKRLTQELSPYLTGTSNVLLAKEYGLQPIGTMAHEYIQAFQALEPKLIASQAYAFDCWAKEYRGDLGIALSDTYSTKAFLRDFDCYFCKLYDGARHDSGDPFVWGEAMIKHYQGFAIDPRQKTLVFSDGLDFPKAYAIYQHFKARIQPVFGIGTNLTNDLGLPRLDIVLKMMACNGQPVAKISESPAKVMCDDDLYLNYVKKVFQIE